MLIAEMALEIFKIMRCIDSKNITKQDIQTSENVAKRNKEIFKAMNVAPKVSDGFNIW
jgi:capsular polysaccharide biosynthesis protein